MVELDNAVAYCGLICDGCTNKEKGCNGCRKGGGNEECYQRICCLQKRIDGCWDCDISPCDKGFFDVSDEVWSGLCRGFIRCIKLKGIEEFHKLVKSKLGKSIEYGDLRFKDEKEIMQWFGISP